MGVRFYLSDENVLKLIMVMVVQLCEYPKTHCRLYIDELCGM